MQSDKALCVPGNSSEIPDCGTPARFASYRRAVEELENSLATVTVVADRILAELSYNRLVIWLNPVHITVARPWSRRLPAELQQSLCALFQ